MTRFFSFLFFVFAFVIAPSALAYTPPTMTAHVTDAAHKLTESDRITIDRKLEDYRLRTGNEIAVFIAASLDGEEAESVAFTAGRTWGIGQKGKDNGVVLLIAPVERKVYIAVGKGAEGNLPDLKTNDIIRQQIKPNLAAGRENYRAAVDAGTDGIMSALDAGGAIGTVPTTKTTTTHHDTSAAGILFALVFFGLMIGVPILVIIVLARALGSAFTSNGRSANRGWVSGSTWSSSNDSSWSSGGGGGSDFGGGGGGGDSGFSGGGGDFGGGGSGDSF